jgi:hypothetical protein
VSFQLKIAIEIILLILVLVMLWRSVVTYRKRRK